MTIQALEVQRTRVGRRTSKEIVIIPGVDLGYVNRNGILKQANGIKIHYSEKRTHIVPHRRGE